MNIEELEIYPPERQAQCFSMIANAVMFGKAYVKKISEMVADIGVQQTFDIIVSQEPQKAARETCGDKLNKEMTTIFYNALLHIKNNQNEK